MLRAEDRLKEALFFLNKLKTTDGKGEEFKQFAFLKILSAADSLNEFSMSQAGFEVSKGELYDFETLVSGFESYLASMQELLNGANLLFNSE